MPIPKRLSVRKSLLDGHLIVDPPDETTTRVSARRAWNIALPELNPDGSYRLLLARWSVKPGTPSGDASITGPTVPTLAWVVQGEHVPDLNPLAVTSGNDGKCFLVNMYVGVNASDGHVLGIFSSPAA
jgi:hypothetical protein